MKFFHKNNKFVSDMMSMIEILIFLINENLKLQFVLYLKKLIYLFI